MNKNITYTKSSLYCSIGEYLYNNAHTITLTDEEFDDFQRWKAKFQLRNVSLNTFIWDLFWKNN